MKTALEKYKTNAKGIVNNRTRNLLHKKHLPEFEAWLQSKGYALMYPAGNYEILRVKSLKSKVPIQFYERARGQHLTTFGEGTGLAVQFLRERKSK